MGDEIMGSRSRRRKAPARAVGLVRADDTGGIIALADRARSPVR